MPRPPQPLPEGLGDLFSVAEAHAAGVPAGRLRATDLERPFRGVRMTSRPGPDDPGGAAEHDQEAGAGGRPHPPTLDEIARAEVRRQATAYAKVMEPGAFVAGRSAGSLLELPIDPSSELVIGVFAPARAPRRHGIRGIKVVPGLAHVRERDGLRMTTPASTWAMLGAELAVRELVVVGDAIARIPRDKKGTLQPNSQLAAIAQLEQAIAAGRRVGIAKLRAALPLIRTASSSPLESEFRIDAEASHLPAFELDVEIFNRSERRIGISELFHRPTRTAIEIEGDHHRVSRRQWNRDIDKYAAYAAEGIEVVRLTSARIRGPRPSAVGVVRDVLLRRGWRPA